MYYMYYTPKMLVQNQLIGPVHFKKIGNGGLKLTGAFSNWKLNPVSVPQESTLSAVLISIYV